MRQRWAIVCLLAVGVIIAYVDRTNLSIALASKDFRSYFDLTDSQRGLLNSAFFWTYTLMQIPAGLLVDRFGVRIPLAVGFGLWCVVAAGTSMATAIWQLVAFRLALGRTPTMDERDALTVYARKHGLANACRVILNLNEFVFVD